MPVLALVGLVAAIALLVLLPTRRLYLAGWSSRALTLYYVSVVGLALVIAELRGPARFLVPMLVVAYIGPFVTARAGIARVLGRDRGGVRVSVPEPRVLPEPTTRPGTPGAEPSASPAEPEDDEPRDQTRTGDRATSDADRGPT